MVINGGRAIHLYLSVIVKEAKAMMTGATQTAKTVKSVVDHSVTMRLLQLQRLLFIVGVKIVRKKFGIHMPMATLAGHILNG